MQQRVWESEAFVQQKTVFVQYLLSKCAVLSDFAEQSLEKN